MKWREWLEALREDQLFARMLRNTTYLFSSSTIGMGLALVQGLAAGWLLGPLVYGQLGIIMSFASNMHRLLSFRMPELVVKYAGQYLVEGRKDRAAALIKAAALTEMVKGMTVEEAERITNQDIAQFLGGLPQEKMHCSVMGREALEAAIANFKGSPTTAADEEIICQCFGITDKEIERAVLENHQIGRASCRERV